MANKFRGEIDAEIGGVTRRLCLTLGALAELETAFGAQDLVALAQRFENGRLSAADLVKIIGAGLRGAGGADTDDDVARASFGNGLAGAAAIAAELVTATFADPFASPQSPPQSPQR
jgi:hypothetical protein